MMIVNMNDNVFTEEQYVSPLVNIIKYEFEGICVSSPNDDSMLENGGVLDEDEGEW